MPFNGSGLFTRVYNWVNDKNSSIAITASRMDTEFNGIASGLSNCITRDGQGKPSAAQDFNGQNLTNVATLGATTGNIATLNVSGLANFSGPIRGSVAGSIVVPGALTLTDAGGGLFVVFGRDDLNGREFTDVVLAQPFGTKLLMGSVIFNSPATRVYSDNGGGFLLLTLSGSTDTYNTIRILRLSAT